MQNTFLLANALIYVFWTDGSQNLFSTDGTTDGSTEIGHFSFFRETFHVEKWRSKDYYSQFASLSNGHLYFEVSENGAKEIWHTDGYLKNTKQVVTDAVLGPKYTLEQGKFTAKNNFFYFSATEKSSLSGDSRAKLDSLFTLSEQGEPQRVIPDIGVLDSILLTDAGLLLKAAPAGKLDWKIEFILRARLTDLNFMTWERSRTLDTSQINTQQMKNSFYSLLEIRGPEQSIT